MDERARKDGPRVGAERVQALPVGAEDHAGDAVWAGGASFREGFGVAFEEGRVYAPRVRLAKVPNLDDAARVAT